VKGELFMCMEKMKGDNQESGTVSLDFLKQFNEEQRKRIEEEKKEEKKEEEK